MCRVPLSSDDRTNISFTQSVFSDENEKDRLTSSSALLDGQTNLPLSDSVLSD